MKTIRMSMLLAFLSSPIFIFSNFKPQAYQPVQASVQADENQNRLRVVANRHAPVPLTLRFTDESDSQLIHEQLIPGGSATVQVNLNLNALPAGNYRVEVGDYSGTQASLIRLSPSVKPSLNGQIEVLPVQ
jgi:hypothetical protein